LKEDSKCCDEGSGGSGVSDKTDERGREEGKEDVSTDSKVDVGGCLDNNATDVRGRGERKEDVSTDNRKVDVGGCLDDNNATDNA
jgi:hypothetical protein